MGPRNFAEEYFQAVSFVPERRGTEGLGSYEWLLGTWEILYPDQQRMIREDYLNCGST
ncbi:MAG: hypothetical protein ACRD3O_00345 [Terriglobia bacterium]